MNFTEVNYSLKIENDNKTFPMSVWAILRIIPYLLVRIFRVGFTHERFKPYFLFFRFCVGGRLRGWMTYGENERKFYCAHFDSYVGFQFDV